MKTTLLFCKASWVSFLFLLLVGSSAFMQAQQPTAGEGPTPGVVHLKLQAEAVKKLAPTETGFGIPQLDILLEKHQVARVEQVFTAPERFQQRHREAGLDRWFTLYYSAKTAPEAFSADLKKHSYIELAEPDYRAISHEYTEIPEAPAGAAAGDSATPQAGTGEPAFDLQWHYDNFGGTGGTPGADINLVPAWNVTAGTPEVIVQVIDSGIDITHIDLDQMLWENPNPGEGGYSNDINGWNFVSNDADIRDGSGHGTHVSGTIVAQNNGIGAAGIAGGSGADDGARVMVMRIFQSNGVGQGASAGSNRTAQAIAYGADRGAVISNNSWGYQDPGVFPDVVKTAIDYFIEFAGYDENGEVSGPVAGGVFISSAGNTPDGQQYFPAAYPPVISVAATDHNDEKTSYSNYGEHVTVAAPGGQLFAGNSEGGVYSTDLQSVYSYKQGTSMASPHVAGVAALIASHFPGISNEELISRLVNTADNIDEQNASFAGLLGTGRINAFRALTEDPPPGRPVLVSPQNNAEDIPTAAPFSWETAVLAETYDVQLSVTADFSELTDTREGLGQSSTNFSGLETETKYYWRVRANNSAGAGLWSEVFSFETGTIVSTGPDTEQPGGVELAQNYPNPFNPGTYIRYTLDAPDFITLSVYSVSGQNVATLEQGQRAAGTHSTFFDASALSSGVYIYRLETGSGQVLQRRMTLVK